MFTNKFCRDEEESIVWFEDPSTLPFVRVVKTELRRRNVFPKSYRHNKVSRVVGFAVASPHDHFRIVLRDWFLTRIFVVRHSDRSPDDGGGLPGEAVDPLLIAPNFDPPHSSHAGSFPSVSRDGR